MTHLLWLIKLTSWICTFNTRSRLCLNINMFEICYENVFYAWDKDIFLILFDMLIDFVFDLIWFDLIWFDLIWFDLIWFLGVVKTKHVEINDYILAEEERKKQFIKSKMKRLRTVADRWYFPSLVYTELKGLYA